MMSILAETFERNKMKVSILAGTLHAGGLLPRYASCIAMAMLEKRLCWAWSFLRRCVSFTIFPFRSASISGSRLFSQHGIVLRPTDCTGIAT